MLECLDDRTGKPCAQNKRGVVQFVTEDQTPLRDNDAHFMIHDNDNLTCHMVPF